MSTITDPIILDSTGQAIKNSIDLLAANINRTASNIPYDNNLTIKGKIDEIDAKTADDIPYSSGVSVKDKIDDIEDKADTNSALIADITSALITQQYHTAEFGTFYQTVKASGTTYQNVPITGIKLTMANSRYTIIGMVLQGSSLGNRFVAYSSWGNASVVITGESI